MNDLKLHPFIVGEFAEDNPFVSEIIKTGKRVI